MASKQIPVVGEAFLGSDPLVQKMIRITFGSSGFSGSNDVDVTTASVAAGVGTLGVGQLLTFADSNYRLLNIIFNVVEVFSVGAINVGVDSDPVAFASDTGAHAADFTAASIFDLRYGQSTGVGAGIPLSTVSVLFGGAWPADSDDFISLSFSGAAALGTEGHCEMYVFYLEVPDQP